MFYFSHKILGILLPTDERIFFRGVGAPPNCSNSDGLGHVGIHVAFLTGEYPTACRNPQNRSASCMDGAVLTNHQKGGWGHGSILDNVGIAIRNRPCLMVYTTNPMAL